MRKMKNEVKIEGRLFQHKLELKTVANKESPNYGKEFINGSIEIATDENLLNIVPIHFTYVTALTKNGKNNATFQVLKKIIDGAPTIVDKGKDEALKLHVDSAVALNEWYDNKDQLVSVKRAEGGFVNIVSALDEKELNRNTFETDIVITSIVHQDADPEKKIDKPYTAVRGAIFNFRNDLMPVEYKVENPDGMAIFEKLEASPAQPYFTKVWGNIVSETIVTTETEESAFGEPMVKTTTKSNRAWVIKGIQKLPYDFGDPNVLTDADLQKAMQDRNVALAEIKKRRDEYQASKNTPSTPVNASATAGGYTF